jgi:HPt (histidine-containing phosphotransfer) domain-containing protein
MLPVFESARLLAVSEAFSGEELNIAGGLRNFSGKEKMYEKGLTLMLNKAAEVEPKAKALLAAGDVREFGVYLHGMKGSLANIGALRMSELAKNLELAGKNDDIEFCELHIEEFCRLFEYFIEKLDKSFNGVPGITAPAPPEIDPELAAGYKKIKEAVGNFDHAGVTETLASLKARKFGEPHDKKIAKMAELAENYLLFDIGEIVDS